MGLVTTRLGDPADYRIYASSSLLLRISIRKTNKINLFNIKAEINIITFKVIIKTRLAVYLNL